MLPYCKKQHTLHRKKSALKNKMGTIMITDMLKMQPTTTQCHHHTPLQPTTTQCHHHTPLQPTNTQCHHHTPLQPTTTQCHHHTPLQPTTTQCHHHTPLQPTTTQCPHTQFQPTNSFNNCNEPWVSINYGELLSCLENSYLLKKVK